MNQNQNNVTTNMPSAATNIPPTPTKVNTMRHTPSTIKKLLPMAAFFMAFATVMTLLLIYYDNTGKWILYRIVNIRSHFVIVIALRHHQFRVNMSQDYEFLNVAQDNPELIMYIKEMLLNPAKEPHHKPLESTITLNNDVALMLKLFNNKVRYFVMWLL